MQYSNAMVCGVLDMPVNSSECRKRSASELEPGIQKRMKGMREYVKAGHQTGMFHAAVASGKSKFVPSNLQAAIGGDLLVVTPSEIDDVDMQSCTTYPSRDRTGRGLEGERGRMGRKEWGRAEGGWHAGLR